MVARASACSVGFSRRSRAIYFPFFSYCGGPEPSLKRRDIGVDLIKSQETEGFRGLFAAWPIITDRRIARSARRGQSFAPPRCAYSTKGIRRHLVQLLLYSRESFANQALFVGGKPLIKLFTFDGLLPLRERQSL